MRNTRSNSLAAAALITCLSLGGCPNSLVPSVNVEVPAIVQAVIGDMARFTAGDAELTANEPGTVIDDLATLDGCWGTIFADTDSTAGGGLFVAYRFDAAAGTFERWSGVVNAAGELWPAAPILSLERGTFEVTGEASVLLTDEEILSNFDEETMTLSAMLHAVVGATEVERPALVTLDGEQMMFFIGAEAAADVNAGARDIVFHKFTCPVEQ